MVPYSTAEELCNVMNIQRGFWTGNESGVVKKVMMIPYIQNKAHELEKKMWACLASKKLVINNNI